MHTTKNTGFLRRHRKNIIIAAIVAAAVVAVLGASRIISAQKQHSLAGYAMNTIIKQSAFGANAQPAMQQVNEAFAAYEQQLSLFGSKGDIARLNAAAGQPGGAEVSADTAALLQQSLALSGKSENAFAVSIAPLTLAWGITSDTPRVLPQAEIDALLPLVNDAAVAVTLHPGAQTGRVELPLSGMGIDLGGIAKGAACTLAANIYEKNGITSALLSIGGNVYARGTKPGGKPWKIGFRDPQKGDEAFIASFTATDKVVAVSGGYERFFEENGKRYIHIIDPRTGRTAQSDIVSVGVVHPNGAEADFYSTTLFVWGKEKALAYMRAGGEVILLDDENTLYVSESLRGGFELHDTNTEVYRVNYVPQEGAA